MRITPKQLEFLWTLYDAEEGREPYWECFEHEMRSAMALHKKGMIEFEDGAGPEKGCEHFTARMTQKGWDWIKNA